MTTSMELDAELDRMSNDILSDDGKAASGDDGRALPPRPEARSVRVVSSSAAPLSSYRFNGGFTESERNLAMAVHIGTLGASFVSGGLLVPLLVPLIAKMVIKDASPALADHIRQQLNFQLTFLAVAAASIAAVLVTLGIAAIAVVPLLLFFFGVEIVVSIKGTIAAMNGETYRFPLTAEFVKENPVAQLAR